VDSLMAAKINAVAGKINAARELARRLAEEKNAAIKPLASPEDVHAAEAASAAAAAQAARADSLARALRKAEQTNDQLRRLKAENEALRDLLLEQAPDKAAAMARLNQVFQEAAARSANPSEASPTVIPQAAAALSAITAAPEVPAPEVPQAEKPMSPAAEVSVPLGVAAAAEETGEATRAGPTGAAAAVAQSEVQEAAAAAEAKPTKEPPPRLPPKPQRPQHVQDRVLVPPKEVQLRAAAAAKANQPMFTVPPSPVPLDGPVRLLYNRAQGPLPHGAILQLKLGLNQWEIQQDIDMRLMESLPRDSQQEWWEANLDLPAEVYRVDYVIYDKRSGMYDNNGYKDYSMELANPMSEMTILELRLAAYRAFEAQRVRYLESENAELMRAVELAAQDAAEAGRKEYRKKREVQLAAEAQAALKRAQVYAATRRQPEAMKMKSQASVPGVFAWTTPVRAGQEAFLAYNKGQGPLANTNSVQVHMYCDGWLAETKQVVNLTSMPGSEVDKAELRNNVGGNHNWMGAWVKVPKESAILDFVFSDEGQVAWDNNNMQDFHTVVTGALSEQELAQQLAQAASQRDEAKEKEGEERAAKRAIKKAYVRGAALRQRRAAMNEFLYTVPYVPVPGQKVEVYYNPEYTALRGRPNIFLKAGWNRWSYNSINPRNAPAIPMEQTISANLGFYMATLDVPEDAWCMDLMFVDTKVPGQPTGFFDNNGGLDYHIAVASPAANGAVSSPGSLSVQAPLKVVHVAVEMAPIAKVGGMGDVVTALGRAVQEEGHTVEVIIPKYDCIRYEQVEDLRQEGSFAFGGTQVRVWRGVVEGLNTTFLEPENGHFWRGCIYGRNDDAVRFEFHCGSALHYLNTYNVQAHIVHCHDWQSAHIAWGNRGNSRCVFTIHNLSYGADLVGRAMGACDVATTVSPTYAQEISGQGPIAPHLSKLYGIRNGIDADIWDPEDDPFLPMNYSYENCIQGKAAAREELRRRLNLANVDVPVVGCVTRLVAQKGIHLIKHAAWRTLERGGQFVLLGSAPDGRVQAEFNALRDQLMQQFHGRAALIFTYDEPLSHVIYAGCDMFLVPSMFEPCGLTQMIAMQFGTVPVVRRTGGLADTVYDVDHDEERAAAAGMRTNGFMFDSTDAAGMDYALNRAISMFYNDRPGWNTIVARIMQQDWSWYSPALDYTELYYKALRS